MILFNATSRRACALSDDKLTTGSVGIQVEFTFSDDWTAAPARIAVFRGSGVSVDVALLEDSCTVPPEVLTQPGSTLTIGVYGTDGAGTVVIPTVYAEAGQIRRGAEPSGVDPTPQTQPLIDQLLAAAQAARNAADEAERLAQSVKDAADAGEFNGQNGDDGNGVWYVDVQYTRTTGAGVQAQLDHMVGRPGATPAAGDLCVVSDGRFGAVTIITPRVAVVPVLGDLSGADGYSPVVTITEIEGGHRITITDEAHPDGQSFDVLDGQGGTVTVDSALSDTSENPVQNKVVKAALDGKGTYSKPASGIPKTDMAEDVQTSLGKADTALQNVKIPKGELNGTSTSTVMTATIDGVTALYDGLPIWLKNGVETSAAGVTLNINNLGAKPIYASQSAATAITTQFNVNYTALLIYNSTRVTGGCWDYVYGYETNTTYTPVKLGFGYTTCSTAEATAAKTAALSSYTLTTGGIVAVKFTNAVPAGATLNINSKGAKAIYYKGAAITAGVIKAGDTVTMIYSTYYHVLSIDRDIPAPSDSNPMQVSYGSSSPGVSAQFARSDHTHELNSNILIDVLLDATAINVPVFLYDGANGVFIRNSPQDLGGKFRSQTKMNFALVVPPNYNSYPVLFTPSKFDTTTGELHLTGIVSGVLYEATLLPGADPTGQSSSLVMVGTMTTTDLALPSAQGVSF